jgi:hypothetical protein
MPKTPFTMSEFEATNNLVNLGRGHYTVIHKRFRELGLVKIRRRRNKSHAEDVWVKKTEFQDMTELQNQLAQLRA